LELKGELLKTSGLRKIYLDLIDFEKLFHYYYYGYDKNSI